MTVAPLARFACEEADLAPFGASKYRPAFTGIVAKYGFVFSTHPKEPARLGRDRLSFLQVGEDEQALCLVAPGNYPDTRTDPDGLVGR